jgi:hypothetical protein
LVAGFVGGARVAGGFRAVIFFGASAAFNFSAFAFSRASCSSLEGIFNVIRFKPEVRASTSSFSFPLGALALTE